MSESKHGTRCLNAPALEPTIIVSNDSLQGQRQTLKWEMTYTPFK
jgi:hypothetical protein